MRAFLGLGSNVGKREQYLKSAVSALSRMKGSTLISISSVYESDPWGRKDQRRFLNQAVLLETTVSPDHLLLRCRKIEDGLERERNVQWGPRTIDIDILLLDDLIIDEQSLQVPHPYLTTRNFVLFPLAEIASQESIPGSGMTVGEALKRCSDRGRVTISSEVR